MPQSTSITLNTKLHVLDEHFFNNGINIQLHPCSKVRNQTKLLQKVLTLTFKADSQKKDRKSIRNPRHNGPSIRGKNAKADVFRFWQAL